MAADYVVGASSQKEFDAMSIASSAHEAFDAAVGKIPPVLNEPGRAEEPRRMACRKGCSFCCSIQVTASASEVLLLKGYITGLSQTTQQNIAEKVRSAYPLVKGKTLAERTVERTPCPLLDNGGDCTVYPARPLMCRSYVSFDVDLCREGALNPHNSLKIPQSKQHFQSRDELIPQMLKHEATLDLQPGHFELIQALHTFLVDPTTASRLLAGESAFAHAVPTMDAD